MLSLLNSFRHSLIVATAITLTFFAFVPVLHAQRVLAPYNFSPPGFYWDSVRKSKLLVENYDFAFLYNPGFEKPDYGYSYSYITRELVLVESLSHIPFPHVCLNQDGSVMVDSVGNPVFEILPDTIETKRCFVELPDSLAGPLIELYRLAVKTARENICEIDVPPIYDAPSWTFFSGWQSGGATTFDIECPSDTSSNVPNFYRIHRAVEMSVREGSVRPIEEVMPIVRDLTKIWQQEAGE